MSVGTALPLSFGEAMESVRGCLVRITGSFERSAPRIAVFGAHSSHPFEAITDVVE